MKNLRRVANGIETRRHGTNAVTPHQHMTAKIMLNCNQKIHTWPPSRNDCAIYRVPSAPWVRGLPCAGIWWSLAVFSVLYSGDFHGILIFCSPNARFGIWSRILIRELSHPLPPGLDINCSIHLRFEASYHIGILHPLFIRAYESASLCRSDPSNI